MTISSGRPEDYNRFGAAPGLFPYNGDGVNPDSRGTLLPDPNGLGISFFTHSACNPATEAGL